MKFKAFMQGKFKNTNLMKDPAEGLACLHLHECFAELKAGLFYNLFSLPIDSIESNRKSTDCSIRCNNKSMQLVVASRHGG